jgi:hypothetical protein
MDLWRVHRSKELQDCLKANYPDIIVDFVPGGCTGKFQPCDVAINRPLKHSVRRSFHQDVVDEVRRQMREAEKNKEPLTVTFDRTKKNMRNQSVGWLWDAYQTVNDETLVKRVSQTFACML